jgi:serralysin
MDGGEGAAGNLAAETAREPPLSAGVSTTICRFCKEDIHDDATRCPYCTSVMAGDDDRRVTYVVDRDLIRFGKFAAGVLAIFVVIGVYAFGFRMEVMVEKARGLQADIEKSAPALRAATSEITAARQELNEARQAASTLSRELEELRDSARTKVSLIEGYVASFQRQLTPEQQKLADAAAAQLHTTSPRFPKLWPNGSILTIKFMDGSADLTARVIKHMEEWLKYANLHLRQIASEDAMIRVSFQKADAWSFVGTDALGVAHDQPTLSLPGMTAATSDDEMRPMVLHEFGHVLGLVEEMRNPNAVIPWNKNAVYSQMSGPPKNWSRDQIDRMFFVKSSSSELPQYRAFDPTSVMMTPVPSAWTNGKLEVGRNAELSSSDKAFIATLYPR